VLAVAWVATLLCAGWVAFAYLGYPLGLLLLRALSARPVQRGAEPPSLSVIIAVHNGGRELGGKLDATLKIDYRAPLEIIVTSDGSTDDSVEVAQRYVAQGVRVIASPERGGKEAAQARAIALAKGDVLVFTDVGTELAAGALPELVAPFADPRIGAVSSEDEVDIAQGEGAYVRYEMALRRLESQTSTLVGLSGSLFAIRRELATPWPADLTSDFRSALEVARRGLRSVSEPRARARYRIVSDPSAEWQRKVRTVRRGLAVLFAYRELLHPRHGRTAYSLFGHKLARFTTPFALLGLFVACALGAPQSPLLAAALGAQLLAYGLAGAALGSSSVQRFRIPRWAAFFLLVQASIAVAWLHHARGNRVVTWTPTRR
jgi:cellulose synthase/poly-beta-1,6-N-acetylglucosamine synthase-like glycosyltransferase